ncbi:MAG: hypothetical protein F6K35_35010, partial [Okeania sp. SIO2H7]|nr:hypothetical protein [Okeania sp. SIO2H7]
MGDSYTIIDRPQNLINDPRNLIDRPQNLINDPQNLIVRTRETFLSGES